MARIVAGLFLSLDGVVEAPEVWTAAYMDDEIRQEAGVPMAGAAALLLGRATFQTFAAAFTGEKADDPFAHRMASIPKYVVSTTLREPGWVNATLVGPDVAGEVAALRNRPDEGMAISGSPTLVRSLLRYGLLDELRLMLFPVVVGKGRRLFGEGEVAPLALRPAGARTLGSGVTLLTYGSAGANRRD